jgi:outer membrane protein OmpA-like peptidoglycan-associated protein
MGDSLSPGIYTLYPKNKYKIKTIDTLSFKGGQKIQFNNLIFKQGSDDLLPEALPELNQLAKWMINENPNVRIRLEGHTDNKGIAEMNVKLSESRVLNVKEYLILKGVDEKRIETIGYGGAFPIGSNLNEETRKLNRRVEFEILDK